MIQTRPARNQATHVCRAPRRRGAHANHSSANRLAHPDTHPCSSPVRRTSGAPETHALPSDNSERGLRRQQGQRPDSDTHIDLRFAHQQRPGLLVRHRQCIATAFGNRGGLGSIAGSLLLLCLTFAAAAACRSSACKRAACDRTVRCHSCRPCCPPMIGCLPDPGVRCSEC